MGVKFDRVYNLCEINNIKIADLEKILDFSDRSIAKWEFKSDNAWISRVQAVADYFDVSLDYLTGKTDNPHSHKTPEILEIENIKFQNSLKQLSCSAKEVETFLANHMSVSKNKHD